MKPSELIKARRSDILSVIAKYRVSNARMFGSALHGDDTELSDLDILVDATPETTLLDLGGIQFDLQTLLGINVDVCTPNDLSARFREQVVREATLI